MIAPKILIPHASGTNRDLEAAQAVSSQGNPVIACHPNFATVRWRLPITGNSSRRVRYGGALVPVVARARTSHLVR